MDFLVRLLIGIPILLLVGWLWLFLFNLFTGIVNGLAYALARLVRRIFGIRAGWSSGAGVAFISVMLAKSLAGAAFWVSIVWYALLYPTGAVVADGSAAIAGIIVVAWWMPSTFCMGLFSSDMHEFA